MIYREMACILIFTVTFVQAQHASNEWRGLIPLHSTKADVEKLLGKPTNQNLNLYETETYVVTLRYSGGTCNENKLSAWNVPKDVVTQILVSPKKGTDTSTLVGKFLQNFKRIADYEVPGFFTYQNEELSVMVQTKAVPNRVEDVIFIEYGPAKSDSRLRCCVPHAEN